MIVVAIVAILAAIAMPAYQSYTARSKFTEVTSGASALKTQVQLCYLDLGTLTGCSNSSTVAASGAGWTINKSTDYSTKYINDILVTNGVITASAVSGEGLSSKKFTLTPTSAASGTINWVASGDCKTAGFC